MVGADRVTSYSSTASLSARRTHTAHTAGLLARRKQGATSILAAAGGSRGGSSSAYEEHAPSPWGTGFGGGGLEGTSLGSTADFSSSKESRGATQNTVALVGTSTAAMSSFIPEGF